ncbi:MAG: DUF3224 domain-containing protein [Propionibacteriaceae bacterium]
MHCRIVHPCRGDTAANRHQGRQSVEVSTMEKVYAGEVTGHSATIFTAAFDESTGVGSYVAMESFEGSLDGRSGRFAYFHSATTHGEDPGPTTLVIVPGTGVGDLTGIVGNGGLVMDADGTHRIWFDYRLE